VTGIRNRPVTGIRLFLEGKKNDRLGVHLQHLSATPGAVTVLGEAASAEDVAVNERDYIEPVRSPLLSHICTAPVLSAHISIGNRVIFLRGGGGPPRLGGGRRLAPPSFSAPLAGIRCAAHLRPSPCAAVFLSWVNGRRVRRCETTPWPSLPCGKRPPLAFPAGLA